MFAKLYPSMYDGTLATKGPWQALVTFQQLLVLCDRFGVVDMTREVIARRTTIPLEIITTGIDALEQPDPNSRRPDDDGRRIVRLDDHRDWGWQIVNYGHYRDLKNAEDRREYQKNLMRERRAAAKGAAAPKPQPPKTDSPPGFDAFWSAYPRKVAKADAARAFAKLKLQNGDLERVIAAVRSASASQDWQREGGRFIPHPATWLNGQRWLDEAPAPAVIQPGQRRPDGSIKTAI